MFSGEEGIIAEGDQLDHLGYRLDVIGYIIGHPDFPSKEWFPELTASDKEAPDKLGPLLVLAV
jgi:hypothetical protein